MTPPTNAVPATPTATFRAIYQKLPREEFCTLLIGAAQAAQNHLNDEEDVGREPEAAYRDGAFLTTAQILSDMLRWRYNIDLDDAPTPTTVAEELKLRTYMYDGPRRKLVDAYMASFESPLDVIDHKVRNLQDQVAALERDLNMHEEIITTETYFALKGLTEEGMKDLVTTIAQLKTTTRGATR